MASSCFSFRESWWRETFVDAFAFIKHFWPFVVSAIVFLAVVDFALAFDDDFMASLSKVKELRDQPELRQELIQSILASVLVVFFVKAACCASCVFSFVSLYLRKFLGREAVGFNVWRALVWFASLVVKYIACFVPFLFLSNLFLFLLTQFWPDALSTTWAARAYQGISFVGVGIFFYILLRWTLLSPLAVLQEPSVLRASWVKTRGAFWRLCWEFSVVSSILFFGWMALLVLPLDLFRALGFGASAIKVGLAVVSGLCWSATALLVAVFPCVALKHLDPAYASADVEADIPQEPLEESKDETPSAPGPDTKTEA